MTTSGDQKNPIDQLVDLFVYAPLGFLYERDEVFDKVVTRGKSQVQLARLMAKMASNQAGGTEAMVGEAVGFAADVVARSITEFGVALGLVPKPRPAPERVDIVDVDEADDPDAADADLVDDVEVVVQVVVDDDRIDDDRLTELPIDDYDSLNARTVIAALDALTPDEVRQIAEYERAGRNRKTILAKADRLAE